MIRYITSSSHFVDLKKNGFIRMADLSGASRTDDYIIFEKDWAGDGYFKAVFIAKNAGPGHSITPADLMALIFDEHDLLLKGYQIHELTNSAEQSEIESMVSRKELTTEEFNSIGSLVYIRDDIPLSYMVNVDIPDDERLKILGLNNLN